MQLGLKVLSVRPPPAAEWLVTLQAVDVMARGAARKHGTLSKWKCFCFKDWVCVRFMAAVNLTSL